MATVHATATVRYRNPLLILLAIGVSLSSGCQRKELPTPHTGWPAGECGSRNGDAYYFPEGALIPNDRVADVQQRRSISRYLNAMDAASLSCGAIGESYRFFWGGGYGNAATVITIADGVATGVQFVPPNEQWPPMVSTRATTAASSSLVARVRGRLEESAFWTAREFVDREGEGNIWLIEARQGNSYKAVTRVSPEAATKGMVIDLIEQAGLPVPKNMRPD